MQMAPLVHGALTCCSCVNCYINTPHYPTHHTSSCDCHCLPAVSDQANTVLQCKNISNGVLLTPLPATMTWPGCVQVWMWCTALTYLAWRYRWRRDRRLAAQAYEHEQQQEQQAEEQWREFAATYAVKVPPGDTAVGPS